MTRNPFTVPLAADASRASEILAIVLAFAFMTGLTVLIVMNRWNRPDLDREHAAYILSQLHGFGGSRGRSVVVRSVAELKDEDTIHAIRGLLTGEDSDVVTVRSATLEILRSVGGELRSRKPNTSTVPARAVQEAFLTALFGALALVPAAAWREASRTSGSAMPSLPEVITAGHTAVDTTVTVATAFPYTDVLFAFALTFGIIGADTLWSLWFLPPVVLTVLAALYWWLSRSVDADYTIGGPAVGVWSVRVVLLAFVVWLIGTVLAGIGFALSMAPLIARVGVGVTLALVFMGLYAYLDIGPVRRGQYKWFVLYGALGLGVIHDLTALAAAVIAGSLILGVWARKTVRGWRHTASTAGRSALWLDIVHSLTIAVAAVTAPLMVGYAGVTLATGKAVTVARILLDAPDVTVLAVGFLAVMVALTLAVVFLSRFRDIRRGFRRALSVQAVRVAVLGRALPVIIMVITAILTLAIVGLNPVVVLAVTFAVGLIARFAWMVFHQVSYQVYTRPTRDKTAGRVVISAREVHDASGDPVYVASVNGYRTAHRRVDPLVNQIRRDAASLLRTGTPDTGSFPRYFYTHGVRYGKVDADEVADTLAGDVRTRFIANVRQTDADGDAIDDKLMSEYPDHVVRKVINDLKEKKRVTEREGEYKWLG